MTTTKKSVVTKVATGARGFGSLPKRTQLAVLCLLVASVLAMLTPLLVSKIATDKTNAVWREQQAQITLQREVIADYQLQTNLVEQAFANFQNQVLAKDLSESVLQEMIQQATTTMQSFDTLANTLNNATYLSDDTIIFLQDLQEQMSAMGVVQGGKESRASDYENHWLTKKILFVNITYGYHISPNLCATFAAIAAAGYAVVEIIERLASLTPMSAAVCSALAIVFLVVGVLFGAGAVAKGCNLLFITPTLPIPCV